MESLKFILFLIPFLTILSCKNDMRKVRFAGKVKKLKTPVIVKVNNIPITVEDYIREKNKLPENLKKLLKKPEKKLQFIQNLIDKQLLYEESKKLKLDEDPEVIKKLQNIKKELMIDALLKKVMQLNVKITKKEVKKYYNLHKDEYPQPFIEVKEEIYNKLKREKEREFFQKYIKKLRKNAKIEINFKEIKNLN